MPRPRCKHCRHAFTPNVADQRYCSDTCRRTAYERRARQARTRRRIRIVAEDGAFLAENHVGSREAAERLGFPSPEWMGTWMRRYGLVELWDQLQANEARRIAS